MGRKFFRENPGSKQKQDFIICNSEGCTILIPCLKTYIFYFKFQANFRWLTLLSWEKKIQIIIIKKVKMLNNDIICSESVDWQVYAKKYWVQFFFPSHLL